MHLPISAACSSGPCRPPPGFEGSGALLSLGVWRHVEDLARRTGGALRPEDFAVPFPAFQVPRRCCVGSQGMPPCL